MNVAVYLVAAVAVAWVGMFLTVGGIGGLLFVILAVVLATLKAFDVIAWSWWWALLPAWGAVSGTIAKMWMVTRDPFWREKMNR